ncbi:MAG: hypothetical protein AABY43_06460 [Candidatus Omnitrophota bacterium]
MLATKRKVLIILCCVSTSINPLLYAQNDTPANKEAAAISLAENLPDEKDLNKTPAANPEEKKYRSFFDLFNKEAYAANIEKRGEKKKLREKWEELTGADIFYPYFKAKEIENWVSEKFKVKFFKMQGRLRFSEGNNQVRYVFSIKF